MLTEKTTNFKIPLINNSATLEASPHYHNPKTPSFIGNAYLQFSLYRSLFTSINLIEISFVLLPPPPRSSRVPPWLRWGRRLRVSKLRQPPSWLRRKTRFALTRMRSIEHCWSDEMWCCRSDWPGLCLFCWYRVSQQSWSGLFCFVNTPTLLPYTIVVPNSIMAFWPGRVQAAYQPPSSRMELSCMVCYLLELFHGVLFFTKAILIGGGGWHTFNLYTE